MIAKAAAWVLVIAVAYGVYTGVKGWSSPWASGALPITTVLPPAYEGCGASCRR